MPKPIVTEVSRRGEEAGELLLSHFAYPSSEVTLTWDNHRWIRLRSFLARFEELATEFSSTYTHPEAGDRSYGELLKRVKPSPPDSYRMTGSQREFVTDSVTRLVKMAEEIDGAPKESRASAGEPRPKPVMRLLPRTVPDWDADARGVPMHDPAEEGLRAIQETDSD
jgi:hypothetical protein